MADHPHQLGADHLEVDYEALPQDASILAHLSAGAFAGIMEHTVMYPVDLIKTRMQMLAAGQPASRLVIAAISRVASGEGAYALWRGVSSVVLGAGPAHAVYFSAFEALKTFLVARFLAPGRSATSKWVTDESHPLIAAGAGIAATTASDALMTPFDVLKQRMQVLEAPAAGTRLWRTAAAVYRLEGVRAFYLLYPTTLFTNIPFAALNFGFYEYSSALLNPAHTYNPYYHCVAGGIAGGIAAALTNPLDCIKTALQTRGVSTNAHMRTVDGFASAARVMYQQGGAAAFTRGWRPRIIFNVPSTAISWTAYEMAKELLLRD
ncbi:mitochondrial carrier [Metschnikowia bicuspidata var. bicuspidata NRRL YB-4993]|uniref:Mitochondrial carrier n=1 Tax=Metschnikowia bicuspidata var. bicuspidata NRRL YB-4993 TaxID=869754 RepID=A0A1A0HBS3_9ASCO|nr:mitochondrial carrier [Metschnikowia bicuspidata var. bicuspidata NRRL YB-4993]OBA21461.1 mitochondrial carrier [Metschnikowia bicuspidata var. bicuspidata NRRL YB-4993]